jgi:hypothetical protein
LINTLEDASRIRSTRRELSVMGKGRGRGFPNLTVKVISKHKISSRASLNRGAKRMAKVVKISVPIRFYEIVKGVVEEEDRWPSIDAMAREAGERIIERYGLR